MRGEAVLAVESVSFFYPGGVRALEGVSLAVPRGKVTAFLGPNGAGKSTLFMHFNGLLKPSSGKVYFQGREIDYRPQALKELRQRVGLVFQDPDAQLFSASVFGDISFGPKNAGLSSEQVRERVRWAMARTGVAELKDRPTHFLSYGQKKKVAIAGVLALKPEVIVCDEPLAGLDSAGIKQVLDMFVDFKARGLTVVFSTHDADAAYTCADYAVIMAGGRVIGAGEAGDILARRDILRRAGLERPKLLEVFEALGAKGAVDCKAGPRSWEELLAAVKAGGLKEECD